ncbi:MAG TPA: phage baseplate assembly protein V [Kofleriaceae bacterium]|nr:phage baseplate assembly protein V [Kofleriaceae bacterium]
MFDAILRMQLGPIVERLAELETEIEDLRRRGENHNRIGTVVAVNPAARRCKVSHGELRTPWIKYFSPAAGEVSETRHPSVGEQCLLINYGAGDGSAQSVALCGIESASFPGVSDSAELHRRTYPDGTESSYEHAAHAFNWKNGPLSVKADRTGVEVMLGGVGFKVTAAGFSHIGGAVDHDGKNIGKDHKHKNSGGPSIGGEPA